MPEGATRQGPDGRHYTKNAAGQAVLAAPLVALASVASGALPPAQRELGARFGASFFNALVTALLLGVFYATARALGVGAAAAFAATVLLGFATPVWVYAKSFMAEPLQGLGLLLALGGSARAAAGERRAAWHAGLGVLVAVSAKASMLPLALACLLPLVRLPLARWGPPLAGLALALAGHLAYNLARFGTPWETGYGGQASAAAFSTPFLVGLYGLLLSSGKGVLWFAPVLFLAPPGWRRMRHAAGGERSPVAHSARRAALGVLAAAVTALLLYAPFEHWAGDGSFGPRYLLPVLPLALLPVAFALDGAPRGRRRVALALGTLGLLVNLGGVLIYFGAQMREAGDYPYTLPLGHPRFMSDSHFNPRFSPIAGHWRMAWRNAGDHLAGAAPRLGAGGPPDPRLGVGEADQKALLRGFDLWWMYAIYAGLPAAAPLGALAALLAAAAWAWRRALAARAAEAGGP